MHRCYLKRQAGYVWIGILCNVFVSYWCNLHWSIKFEKDTAFYDFLNIKLSSWFVVLYGVQTCYFIRQHQTVLPWSWRTYRWSFHEGARMGSWSCFILSHLSLRQASPWYLIHELSKSPNPAPYSIICKFQKVLYIRILCYLFVAQQVCEVFYSLLNAALYSLFQCSNVSRFTSYANRKCPFKLNMLKIVFI